MTGLNKPQSRQKAPLWYHTDSPKDGFTKRIDRKSNVVHLGEIKTCLLGKHSSLFLSVNPSFGGSVSYPLLTLANFFQGLD